MADLIALAERVEKAHGESLLWLWMNFVAGRPEYWAFDNPFPCYPNGDPMTLGEPCGYAIFKRSMNGNPDVSDDEALAMAIRARSADNGNG